MHLLSYKTVILVEHGSQHLNLNYVASVYERIEQRSITALRHAINIHKELTLLQSEELTVSSVES